MQNVTENRMEVIDHRFSIKVDKPTYREVKDDQGRVIDYLDVRLEGYANTFNLDRGGDQTIPGCFGEHLPEFMTNPVLLCDHMRDTAWACGKVESAYEDQTGLKVSGMLSNSPSEKMRDLRFKCVEGVLRTFSIGGRFHGQYVGEAQNPKYIITKVELREISIVTVPMNKESLFEVKEEVKPLPASQGADKLEPEKTAVDKSESGAEDDRLIVEFEGQEFEIIEKEQ